LFLLSPSLLIQLHLEPLSGQISVFVLLFGFFSRLGQWFGLFELRRQLFFLLDDYSGLKQIFPISMEIKHVLSRYLVYTYVRKKKSQ